MDPTRIPNLMKRLLLIVFTTFFTPIHMFAGGTWVTDGRAGAMVWNNYPRPDDSVTWSGAKDGNNHASGRGTLCWYKSGRLVTTYETFLLDGRADGFSVNHDPDGTSAQGYFVDGLKDGIWQYRETGKPPYTKVFRKGKVVDASAISQRPDHWMRTINNNAVVWNNRPLPGDTVTWAGETDEIAYAHGHGTLIWLKDGTPWVTYTGQMLHGRLEGFVQNRDQNGDYSEGHYKNGLKQGTWIDIHGYIGSGTYTEVRYENYARIPNSEAVKPIAETEQARFIGGSPYGTQADNAYSVIDAPPVATSRESIQSEWFAQKLTHVLARDLSGSAIDQARASGALQAALGTALEGRNYNVQGVLVGGIANDVKDLLRQGGQTDLADSLHVARILVELISQ
jgi:hypothetical protein